jgi:hypothetical protein
VDKVVVGDFIIERFGFRLSLSAKQSFGFIPIYKLILPGGQTGEAWEKSKSIVVL